MKNWSAKKLSKSVFIAIFILSLAGLFIFVNFLMMHRPNYEIISQGLIYPFLGKGHNVFISSKDYILVAGLLGSLVVSMLSANYLNRTEK